MVTLGYGFIGFKDGTLKSGIQVVLDNKERDEHSWTHAKMLPKAFCDGPFWVCPPGMMWQDPVLSAGVRMGSCICVF